MQYILTQEEFEHFKCWEERGKCLMSSNKEYVECFKKQDNKIKNLQCEINQLKEINSELINKIKQIKKNITMKVAHIYTKDYLGKGYLVTDNILYIQNRLIQLEPRKVLADYIEAPEWKDFIESQDPTQICSLCI
jgi:hypothetical protein